VAVNDRRYGLSVIETGSDDNHLVGAIIDRLKCGIFHRVTIYRSRVGKCGGQ